MRNKKSNDTNKLIVNNIYDMTKLYSIFFGRKYFLTYILTGFVFLLFSSVSSGKKEQVVQINIDKILNARPVTTLTDGKLVTWTKGIDGNGEADGYLTMAAALFNGDKDPKALPDNPLFTPTDKHPEVLLHYSNHDGVSKQAVAINGTGSFSFDVPAKKYSGLFLAFTSAEGASQIKVSLKYTDGVESKSFEVPDYYKDIPADDPDFCYLAHDLAKWGKTNNMTEKDHHNIDLLNIHPDENRKLVSIQVEKSEAGYLVFWAATGVKK
jgi:hypothetical protein